ncbi:MAG: RNase H family protein [Nakamurella sp.]
MPEPLEPLAMQWPDEDEPAPPRKLASTIGARAASVAAAPVVESASEQVLVATDGSCLRNPGGATGWAYVRSDGAWAYAGRPAGTNQIGELLAVVLALADHPDVPLEIHSDSAYAIGCATTWKKGWQRNNYVNSQKEIVSNLEIIRRLHELLDARTTPVTFTKVKGHDLSNRWPLNTAVDVVCGQAAEATRVSGADVSANGMMEINWESRSVRGRSPG